MWEVNYKLEVIMVRKILNTPPSDVKAYMIRKAWKEGKITCDDLHRIKRQWRNTTTEPFPKVYWRH